MNGRFEFDPDRSRVVVRATSSIHPISADSWGISGYLVAAFDTHGRLQPDVAPEGELRLPSDGLSSGNVVYDREIRKRIDVRKFPTISARLAEMKAVASDGRCLVRGDVTFMGTTVAMEGEMLVAVDPGSGELHLTGRQMFDITAFNLQPPRVLTIRVHPQVDVAVDIVGRLSS